MDEHHGSGNVLACRVCGQAHAITPMPLGTVASCIRCGTELRRRTSLSLHWTAALSLAALILYVPANTFPILHLEIYGATSENTVWQGVVRLYQDHDQIIAVVVLLASIVIPLLKLIGLFVLVGATVLRRRGGRRIRTWIYRIIDVIGRWAMLDVFVLAILVSLVKLQKLATIIPGKGLFAFGMVIVLTLFASACFDPHLIWNDPEVDS